MEPQREFHYVLAFVFDETEQNMLLIYKDHPTHLADKWNGIGGHVEPGESVGAATCRELFEEANLVVSPSELKGFGMVMGENYKLYCSAVKLPDDRFSQFKTKTSEKVDVHDYRKLCEDMLDRPFKYGPDLSYLIPMAKVALSCPDFGAAISV